MEGQTEVLGLHERRRRKAQDGTVNFSQIRRPPSVRTDINKRFSAIRLALMTPPETPMSPQEVQTPQSIQHSLFHNYLRAFCHFDQPTNDANGDEALLMTAAIRPGDLILVHSIHKNGWADGTVLTTGARGWLPTNYCETFDHPYLRNLLNAMTQFWDLLGAGEDANLSTFVRQDYIRGLIAGVRYLLEHADCLHRDAALVQRNASIRRMRKGLLADLSTLVKIAKRLQETISEPFAGEVIHVLVDDLMSKAFRVVTRAVGFVDMLTQETMGTERLEPSTPATTESASPHGTGKTSMDGSTSLGVEVVSAVDSAIALFPPTPGSSKPSVTPASEARGQPAEEKDKPRSPVSFRPASGVLAHRVSVIAKRDKHNNNGLASERLSQAHDECISHIGAFIGLHLHSRPSCELVSTTNRLVKACEGLLHVVDQIASHDTQQTMSVLQARINFQRKLDELTKSTKDVFKFSDAGDEDIVMMPEQTNHLVNVGTSLIRTVGECVIKARKLIEQVGDVELDSTQAQGHCDNDAAATAGASVTEEVKRSYTTPPMKAANTSPATNKRLSTKMLPPPPPLLQQRAMTSTAATDFARASYTGNAPDITTERPVASSLHKSLPPPPRQISLQHVDTVSTTEALHSSIPSCTSSASPPRKYSVGASMTSSTDTQQTNIRDSNMTTVSESTRATTPDNGKETDGPDAALLNRFGSLTSLRSAATTDESSDVESQLLQKTYAHELILNKDGQVSGGSLEALVEQLTTHDSAPDPQFVSAFFLTFRSFTTSRDLAQALIQRFDYAGESKNVGTPVRLRIYNVFKGWLEVYWIAEADRDALGDVRYFALHKLKPHLPQAGERLVELTRKVTSGYSTGTFAGPLVSAVGKSSMSIGSQYESTGTAPEPIISKSQLNSLRSVPATCNITDFDPLELARQLTLLASTTFCEIHPEELLSLDWNKKDTARAQNVRNLCILNTDLAHVVGDTILAPDDAKKRALVIKHWSKVASQCLELNNYESLMAIMCSLNSSVVQRLKRTWDAVSKKTKARIDELDSIVDFSRNHASLRRRLEKPVAPCLPFLGIYLTDLTFVDAGNPKTRELPGTGTESGDAVSVINFDKHMRMAKIISHLQKFQIPYKLQEIPEMKTWLQQHLQRMRDGHAAMVGQLHRRSMIIEPKNNKAMPEAKRHTEPMTVTMAEERPKTAGSGKAAPTTKNEGPKFELFMKTSFTFRSRNDLPPPDAVEQK
jgi:hypothetical protein